MQKHQGKGRSARSEVVKVGHFQESVNTTMRAKIIALTLRKQTVDNATLAPLLLNVSVTFNAFNLPKLYCA